jgi:NAD(P) transhydrogenase
MIVLGGGVVGVEYTSIFAALGLQVTLIDVRERLLPFLDHEIGDLLHWELQRLGVKILQNERQQKVERPPGAPPRVRLTTSTGATIEADVLLHCIGRRGNTDDLGLDRIGLTPDARGLLHVNENYQTALPHIYAVGDVIGFPALAATSMEQGRIAAHHACGEPLHEVSSDLHPIGIYSIPEISFVGRTEEQLTQDNVPFEVGVSRYRELARGQIIGDSYGVLKLLVSLDTRNLLGVHVFGTGATELIHIGQAVMGCGGTVDYLVDAVFNYPTLAEAYKVAALDAMNKMRQIARFA